MSKGALLKYLVAITVLSVVSAREGACAKLDVGEYVARYHAHDLARNEGRGASTSTISSGLAWSESYILMEYIMLYRVTKDVYWLDKIRQHSDQMIYGMTQDVQQTEFREYSVAEVDSMVTAMIQSAKACDFTERDGDGHLTWYAKYPGWYTDRYTPAHIKVTDASSKTAKLAPVSETISDIKRAHEVTGHEYRIHFGDDTHYTVQDLGLTPHAVIAESVELGETITQIPGASFKVEGTPKAGDSFMIETVEPKVIQYAVHDGMVLYPITQFIEIVLNDAKLRAQFGEKAKSYIRLIKEVFATKWERYWMELENNAGAYKSTRDPAGRVLPHNQYTAMCRAYLILQDKNVSDDPVLREKASKMIRYFKRNLKPTGKAWTWNYWDWGTGEDEHSGPEDVSHASINVGTAIEAYHRGIEFERQDMVRFAHTFLDQMWNGAIEDVKIGDQIDSAEGGESFYGGHWIELCEFDPKVFDVCLAWFKKKGEPAHVIPGMLYGQHIVTKPQ